MGNPPLPAGVRGLRAQAQGPIEPARHRAEYLPREPSSATRRSGRDLAARLSVFAHSFTADEARALQAAAGGDVGAVASAIACFEKDALVVGRGRGRGQGPTASAPDVFKKALYSSPPQPQQARAPRRDSPTSSSPGSGRTGPASSFTSCRAERYAEAAPAPCRRTRTARATRSSSPSSTSCSSGCAGTRRPGSASSSRSRPLLFNSGKIAESEAVLQKIMRAALAGGDPQPDGLRSYHQICNYNAMTYAFQKAVLTGQKALYYYGRSDVSARSVQNVLKTIALAQVMRNDVEEATAPRRSLRVPGRGRSLRGPGGEGRIPPPHGRLRPLPGDGGRQRRADAAGAQRIQVLRPRFRDTGPLAALRLQGPPGLRLPPALPLRPLRVRPLADERDVRLRHGPRRRAGGCEGALRPGRVLRRADPQRFRQGRRPAHPGPSAAISRARA